MVAWLSSIALFTLVMAGTPGPNNLLLAASGLQVGFRRTVPLILGIEFGMLCQLLLVSLGLHVVFDQFPALGIIMRALGTAYVVWLAWHLWNLASLGNGPDVGRPVGPVQGAALQLVNPKSWIAVLTLGSGLFSQEQAEAEGAHLLGVIAFAVVIALTMITWAAFGTVLRTSLNSARSSMLVGRALALLALASAATFWL